MNCPFQRSEQDRTKQDRTMKDRTKEDRSKKTDYAMPADFCRMFADDVDHLYTLAWLLTADRHKAEQCLVAGLEDCLHANAVFREWAHSWAKRMVVKNAIRMTFPSTSRNETKTAAGIPEPDTLADAITSLKPFDRFVYVLSVLEKYSARECSMLLDCTVEKVTAARTQALQVLAGVGIRNLPPETALTGVVEGLRQVCGEVL
jgi:DNA-directed RNA polymerase specialized sigma24 family protein